MAPAGGRGSLQGLEEGGGVGCMCVWGRGSREVAGGWRLPVQVNEVVWECRPLPQSLYSVWSFALAWGDFFFFNTPTGETVLACGRACTCCCALLCVHTPQGAYTTA